MNTASRLAEAHKHLAHSFQQITEQVSHLQTQLAAAQGRQDKADSTVKKLCDMILQLQSTAPPTVAIQNNTVNIVTTNTKISAPTTAMMSVLAAPMSPMKRVVQFAGGGFGNASPQKRPYNHGPSTSTPQLLQHIAQDI